MIQALLADFRVQEARGHLRGITPARATLATILGSGLVGFARGYYGQGWNDTVSEARRTANAEDTALHFQDAMLSELTRDIRPWSTAMMSIQEATSTDFTILLDNIRNRVVRETYQPVTDTPLMDCAIKRTTSNFRELRGVRFDSLDELVIRPEGTDVTFAEIGYTTDNYAIASYELGWRCTWELIKNDDLTVAQHALMALGKAARRTRAKTLLRAILAGLTATRYTPLAGVGGPTIANLDDVLSNEFAAEVTETGTALGTTITDIDFPTKWKTTANTSLHSAQIVAVTGTKTPAANPVYELCDAHEDLISREILGSDWIAYDRNFQWLEFATLDDFQAGPATYTQLPDVVENLDHGSFTNHSIGVKVGDAHGALVTGVKGVRLVAGS